MNDEHHILDRMAQTICILARDGREVFRGTYIECLGWIHRHHSYSLGWACQYEGYTLTETTS